MCHIVICLPGKYHMIPVTKMLNMFLNGFKYISVLFSSLLYGQMYFFHWNGNCTWYHKKCAFLFFFLLFGNVLLHTDMVLLVFLKNNLSGFTVYK